MQDELEAIIGRFGADTGTIHLVEDGFLILKANVGLPAQVAQVVARVPIGKGMAGLAAERNEPVSSCNIQNDRTGDVRPGAKRTGVNGATVVPIRNPEGRAVGVLGIGVHRAYEYSDTEVASLLEEAARLAETSSRTGTPPITRVDEPVQTAGL
jgi:L-methionine (R)-S-oxide reductase